ncbi:MAG: UDP-N-acetylmuramate dehydrogenase [Micromonosporaceae bacterium]
MREVRGKTLSAYTTLRLGGPANQLIEIDNADESVATIREADANNLPILLLAGGSNVVIRDTGFSGTAVVLRSAGVRVTHRDDTVELTVAAGHTWDDVVARAVAEGWSGIECLSGIPGSAGATPIQNVGAYGQEIAETITAVRVYDRHTREERSLGPAECGFAYRASIFKGVDRWTVLEVTYRLRPSRLSGPIRYAELARALGVELGEAAPLDQVRQAVLALRRRKGMVLDPGDPDTCSVGSFFMNPVLDPSQHRVLLERCARHLGSEPRPMSWPAAGDKVKVSAAWLIERAGFAKGHGRDGVAISSKHTLALTNQGGGTTKALLELAREIRDGVHEKFAVTLRPEPVLVDVAL